MLLIIKFQCVLLAVIPPSIISIMVCSRTTKKRISVWTSLLGYISRAVQIMLSQIVEVKCLNLVDINSNLCTCYELFHYRKAENGLKKVTDQEAAIINNRHILSYGNFMNNSHCMLSFTLLQSMVFYDL